MNLKNEILELIKKSTHIFKSEQEKNKWMEEIISNLKPTKLKNIKNILDRYFEKEIEIEKMFSENDTKKIQQELQKIKNEYFEQQKELQVKIHIQEDLLKQKEEKKIQNIEQELQNI